MHQPTLELEKQLWDSYGGRDDDYALSFDEAGRGPLFGPVTVGTFVYNPQNAIRLNQLQPTLALNDSKKMSPKSRQHAWAILSKLPWVKVRHVSVQKIEHSNINRAIEAGIKRLIAWAQQQYKKPPLFLLMDGNYRFLFKHPFHGQIKGDEKCLSISAASVAAKVSRDELMVTAARRFPGYALESNKGYGTKAHLDALSQYGLTKFHRLSFLKNFDFTQKNQ